MMERLLRNGSICFALLCLAGTIAAAEPSRDSLEFFEAKIRPVLVEKCYSCHSEHAKKLKGDLKLDTAEGVLRGGESGLPCVIPNHPEKSKLIEAIEYGNADLQMPPKEKLSAEVIENFRAWVTMGAPDPRTAKVASSQPSHLDIAAAKRDWWSFKLPQPQTPPAVKNAAWAKTRIDQFILAKLESKNIAPSKPADKRTLIRRATFDLIGLPPTLEEISAFEADTSADAFEKVVDRLLANPHYGERWGRYWLDIARYADTKGYVFQEERKYPFAYTFRDWVVRSLNEDLPYDQFIIEQIAADRLKLGSDNRPLAAMGFLTVGRRFLNNQPDIIDDRMDVICRGTLAMTVGCARCHDHKFDPIPTKDYYSLYGIFASATEPKDYPEIGAAQKTPETLAFEAKLAAENKSLADFRAKKFTDVVADVHSGKSIAGYLVAARAARDSNDNVNNQPAAAFRFNLRRGLLMRWKTYMASASKATDPVWAGWAKLSALPDDQIAANVEAAAKATQNRLIAEALISRHPKSVQEVADCYGSTIALYAGSKPLPDADAEALRHITDTDAGPIAVKLADLDTLLTRQDKNEMVKITNSIAKLVANDPASPARAMVINDLPQPVEPHIFKRGNPANVGDAVPRAFLAVLSADPRPEYKKDSGRLELAQAIASKDNPLTARVIVNRVWGHHFGQAIVRTPSDFGRRGDLPTHPELLDYLALRFENEGWSIKKLHKEIMLSAVYQQASDDNPTARMADPENLLLWKFNRQRLDFEATRDALLAVSGQIDATIGGHPVDLIAQPFTHRRTIYGFIDRQNLPNIFRAFDFASPDAHSPQRYFTTVPQQALFMMNSPFVIDSAKAVIKRPEIAAAASPQKRIEKLYQAIFDRDPTADEMQLAISFIGISSGVESSSKTLASIPIWQYGYGEFDADLEITKTFHALPYFNGTAWQGAPALPAPGTGFALLTATGGHPGNDQQHAVIRRWTAPRDGVISIDAILEHNATEGDGVRARIVSSRDGLLGTWTAKTQHVATKVAGITIQKGDTIDFVVDCLTAPTFDSFGWSPTIKLDAQTQWSAKAQFSNEVAPRPDRSMDPWEKYAQVLLETNEFVFVD